MRVWNAILISVLLVAAFAGGYFTPWGRNQEATAERAREGRREYFKSVHAHFAGHPLWRGNGILKENVMMEAGGSHLSGGDFSSNKEIVFFSPLKATKEVLIRETVATYARILLDMDVFPEVTVEHIGEGTAFIGSKEGWVSVATHWKEYPKPRGASATGLAHQSLVLLQDAPD